MNKKHIVAALQALDIQPNDTLMVHSSMKGLGPIDGGAEAVLAALLDYMQGGLLLMPAHSWAEDSLPDNTFDPEVEPSCVGVLSELFRLQSGVYRSLHPTHSVCAKGHKAEHFITGEQRSDTPCPRHGCWGKLYDWQAKILFLGCDASRNTYLHSIEEWAEIPQRLTEHYVPMRISLAGDFLERPMRRHASPVGDISLNYGKLLAPMLELGIAKRQQLGSATVTVAEAKPMGDLCLALLVNNQDLFIDSQPISAEQIAAVSPKINTP